MAAGFKRRKRYLATCFLTVLGKSMGLTSLCFHSKQRIGG
jgi:hypothetical protein